MSRRLAGRARPAMVVACELDCTATHFTHFDRRRARHFSHVRPCGVFGHYYAYAAKTDEDLMATEENLWEFCKTALGA